VRQFVFVCLLLVSSFAFSQSNEVLTKGHSEWGVFVGGAQGFGKRSGTHLLYTGGRYGRVLTGDHLGSWLRGNLEARIEVLPLVQVWQAGKNATGGEFKPLTLVWNFKGNHTVKPFFELGGGLLITNHDVPLNTNNVNFTPQGGPGFHFYTKDRRHAWTLQTKYMHISNAGLDHKNSGVNAAIQLTIGYTWFR
jgi:Lipid A 3-O-deacylase (PagL)